MAERKRLRNSSSLHPSRSDFFKSISREEKRHGRSFPSDVSRSLLHPAQKWSLMALIKPTTPFALPILKFFAGPEPHSFLIGRLAEFRNNIFNLLHRDALIPAPYLLCACWHEFNESDMMRLIKCKRSKLLYLIIIKTPDWHHVYLYW